MHIAQMNKQSANPEKSPAHDMKRQKNIKTCQYVTKTGIELFRLGHDFTKTR